MENIYESMTKTNAEDAFVKAMEGFDAIIVRCNPGQINAAGGQTIIGGMNGWQNRVKIHIRNGKSCYGYRDNVMIYMVHITI